MKFGEVLIKEGVITKEQLNAALERQVIFGGRLGTNIVELGLLREEELTQFLSKHLKIKSVPKKDLDSVPQEVIDAISSDLAIKYNIVPYRLEKKRLFVATFDAMKMEIMDELRFKTSYDVIPHIVSEIRFIYALEKHYGIKRDMRFISVIDGMQEEEAIKEVFDNAPKKEEVFEVPLSKKETAVEEEPKKVPPEEPKVEPKVEVEKEPEEIEVPIKKEEKSQTLSTVDVLEVKELLVNIKDKDEIAQILISEGERVAERRAMFVVKGNKLEGWKGENINVNGFTVDADPTSIFSEVINKKNFYRGPLPNTPGNNLFSSILGGLPQDCVIIPVMIRDRMVAVIYADNGVDNVLTGNINYLNALASLASLSFEILILKKRIRDSKVT
ncbi:MAG: hypothetical protein V3V59_07675 [Thermodesulfovibrionales bacterium]